MFASCGYRTALYLSALIAAVHGSFYGYALSYLPSFANGVLIYVLIALAICTGLWLLSKVARYAGTAFYLFSAVAAAFPWLDFDRKIMMTVGVVWGITMGILSLVAGLILLFSRTFDKEFAAELEKRPVYKKHLLRAVAVLIVLAAVTATLNDIVNMVAK